MKLILLNGRVGHVLFILLYMVLLLFVMLIVASYFMAFDPDGHITRNWLHQSRWELFGWRIAMYVPICVTWMLKVRPAMLQRWPETRQRLLRTELLSVFFILATEYVAWTSVV